MNILVRHLTAISLVGAALGMALIAGCGNDSDEGATAGPAAENVSPAALATAAPVLNKDRYRPGAGQRHPKATNSATK